MADAVDRWPPVYDEADLARVIEQLADRRLDYARKFYEHSNHDPAVFQGDVVAFSDGVPVFDETRQPNVVDEFEWWLVIGNSCDMAREISDVPWSQIVPVHNLGSLDEIDPVEVDRLRRYRLNRKFYLPPWDSAHICRVADFLRPIAIHRAALQSAPRVARLSRLGWMLLHANLVRFLARDDGRYD
jgi:hypothetical protein